MLTTHAVASVIHKHKHKAKRVRKSLELYLLLSSRTSACTAPLAVRRSLRLT